MSRLTRSEIETMFDDLILAHPIYTPQLRALREQSLSQEAVRDEALEEAAMAIPSSQPRCEELRTAIRALKK